MNTFETSKTFVSHAAFVVFAANRGRCPGDGSSLEGGGVSSEGPSAVAHSSRILRANAWFLAGGDR